MTHIHPSAIVDPGAELAPDVEVGPYALIGPHVRIGAGTTVGAHAQIEGRTTIGRDNRIFAYAALGGLPQDKKYGGEPTRLEIGDRNVIREFCTFNVGTEQGGGVTRVGSDNWIMAYVHIAHDCAVADQCIFANNASLAGHVEVGEWVILGGLTGVHQFVRIGAHSMTGAGTILLQDLPPYVICQGNPAQPHGLNAEGLKRRNFGAETVTALRRAYRTIYREGLTVPEALSAIDQQMRDHEQHADALVRLRRFVAESRRGIIR